METYTSSVYQQQLKCLIKLSNSLSYGFRRQPTMYNQREYNFDIPSLAIAYPNTDDITWETEVDQFFENHGIFDEFPNFRDIIKTISPKKIAWLFPRSTPDVKRPLVLWTVLFFLYDYTQEIEMAEHGTVENDCLDQIEEVVCAITGNCSNTIKEPRSILRAFNDLGKELKKQNRSNDLWIERWARIWRIWSNSLKVERDLLRKKMLTGKHPETNIIFQWSIGNSGVLNLLVLLDYALGDHCLSENWYTSSFVLDIQALSNCIIIYQNAIVSHKQRKTGLNIINSLCEQFGISLSEACDVCMQMHEKTVQEIADKCSKLVEVYCYDLSVMRWIELQKGFIDGFTNYHNERIRNIRTHIEV